MFTDLFKEVPPAPTDTPALAPTLTPTLPPILSVCVFEFAVLCVTDFAIVSLVVSVMPLTIPSVSVVVF